MALTHLGLKFDYETEQDPRKAPKGKLPYLIIDGERIADSELIFERLNTMTQGKLYAGLTPEEKATGVAFSRLAEDHLYWMGVASRWLDDKWYPNIVSGFFGFVPGLFRSIAANGARKTIVQTYDLHGLGRHTFEEQKGFAKRVLQAIADIVCTKNYIVGGALPLSILWSRVCCQVLWTINLPPGWAISLMGILALGNIWNVSKMKSVSQANRFAPDNLTL